jgi:multisubunit Na+/H+ antiporter MnhE subunit
MNVRAKTRGGPGVLARVGATIVTAMALFALWMLLVDTSSTAELLAALAATLLGVLATRLVFKEEAARMAPAPWLPMALARQLARVPADLWLLAVALARALAGRRRPGRFHRIPLTLGLDPAENARRAAIELAGSLAPNTIVLGVDEREVIVHQLADRRRQRLSLKEIQP